MLFQDITASPGKHVITTGAGAPLDTPRHRRSRFDICTAAHADFILGMRRVKMLMRFLEKGFLHRLRPEMVYSPARIMRRPRISCATKHKRHARWRFSTLLYITMMAIEAGHFLAGHHELPAGELMPLR